MDFYESLFIYCGYQFNDEQKAAISHFQGPALTLAVPGSGKTTLLLARTVCLVREYGVNPNKILTMTFSKAAANDMNQRYLEKYYPHFKYKLNFSTIHSFSYKVLKAYRKRLGKPISLIDGGGPSKLEILSGLYRQIKNEYLGEEAFEELSSALSYIKNMMLMPAEFQKSGIKFPMIEELYLGYEKYKQIHHLIDFDDMLSETLYALQDNSALLESVREAYPFIQVDETQDTSKLQHELIKLIAYPKNNLFVVADDDQSIYGFRGAFPDMILNFDKIYKGSSRYHLNLNYRSKDEILETCGASIVHNKKRYPKKLEGVRGKGGLSEMLYFESIDERNDHLEEIIQNTLGQAQTKASGKQDVGILYRNHMSALSVIDRLMSLQVPFTLKDGKQKLSEKWLVKDLAAFWRLSNDLNHLESFEKICYRTSARISRAMLDYVRLNHRGRNVFDVLLEAPGVNGYKLRTLRTLESDLLQLKQVNAYDALQIIENNLGYQAFMSYAIDQMGYSEISINNLWASLKSIARRQKNLGDLLDRLLALDGYIAAHESSSLVKLSTIHSAKGQEYHTVILIDVNYGLLPSIKEVSSELDERTLEEDRRLFYVGLSRAKERCYILHAKFQNGDYVSPSPFLKEIEKKLNVRLMKPISHAQELLDSPFVTGQCVKHALFGSGTILAIDGDRISIGFEDRIRDLSLRVCVEKNLLQS